jgi:hypothetical protein
MDNIGHWALAIIWRYCCRLCLPLAPDVNDQNDVSRSTITMGRGWLNPRVGLDAISPISDSSVIHAVAKSLYRLSYPGHSLNIVSSFILNMWLWTNSSSLSCKIAADCLRTILSVLRCTAIYKPSDFAYALRLLVCIQEVSESNLYRNTNLRFQQFGFYNKWQDD